MPVSSPTATAWPHSSLVQRATFLTGRISRLSPASTHLLGFRRPVRPIVPVLCRRDVGHPPLVPIPAVEAIHLERPEAGHLVAEHDEAIGVAHLYAKGAVVHAALSPAERQPCLHPTGFMGTVARVVVPDRVRISGVHPVQDLQSVFVA